MSNRVIHFGCGFICLNCTMMFAVYGDLGMMTFAAAGTLLNFAIATWPYEPQKEN